VGRGEALKKAYGKYEKEKNKAKVIVS